MVRSIDFPRARALSLTGQSSQASRLLDRLDSKQLAEAEPLKSAERLVTEYRAVLTSAKARPGR